VILLDTSGLLSALDESQRYHDDCAKVLGEASAPLLLSPFVLAELDYLLMRHIGQHAQTVFLEEVARGAYQLEQFDAADVARAREIIAKYADLAIGLADASIVVLAERYATSEVLTLDQRHFRALRVGQRKRFKVLPFDR
jgi:predicted nucleic acid-binding protein